MPESAHEETGVPEYEDRIRKIPLDSLSAGITNVRTSPGSVDDLAQSMKVRGLEHPILVRPATNSPGMFEVVAGSRRLAAARQLGWKRVDARVVNCDEIDALCMSLDENEKRGNLSARELGEVIGRLTRLCPEDPGNERAVLKWVAHKLQWTIRSPKGREYPDLNRVRKALEDSEFQKLVPGITIKVRNQGDFQRPTAPLSVARQVMPILTDARVKENLDRLPQEQAQKTREDFLRAFASAPARNRRDLRDAFVASPTRPVKEIVSEVEHERTLQMVVAFKASPDLVDRIEQHKKAVHNEGWTRSDAVKDLVERGLKTVGLGTELPG